MAEKQKGELFAGTLYLSEYDPDADKWGEYFTIECDQLSITAPSERLEAISRSRENYGQAHTTYHRANPTEVSLNFTQADRSIMAAKLSGKIEALTRAAVTLSDVEVTLGALGGWVEIGTQALAVSGIAVKATVGATKSYTAGVDYEVNPRLGLIRPLAGGAIAANATVFVSATGPALAGQRIQGASRYSREYRGYLDGLNLVTNEDALVHLRRLVVSSEEAQDFLQEELSATALTGRLLIPANGDKPYAVDYPTPA